MPAGSEKPEATVVTVQGTKGPGVTIETEPSPPLAVQTRMPSNVSPKGEAPRELVKVVTAPAASPGRIWQRLPGLVGPATKTRLRATSTPPAVAAPVQVSSSRASLPRTRETVSLSLLATQRSAPSDATPRGRSPTVVVESRTGFWIL